MICKNAKKYLETYIDGELEPALILEIETHLESCENCSARTVLERRLKSELRALSQVRAPDHLRKNIEGLSKRSSRIVPWIGIGALPVAAAAALVVAFAFSGTSVDTESDEPLAIVAQDVVERHSKALPMEVSGADAKSAANWFRGKVDFPVRTPNLQIRNASFNGARLSNVRSHQAAHMSYNVDGHRVTVMIFNPRKAAFLGGETKIVGDREVHLVQRNGYNVAIFSDGGIAYALSSDLPAKRLLEFVAAFDRGK